MSDSRGRRDRQNVLTLIGALVASLAVVIAIVLVTVRPDVSLRDEVDWEAIHAASPQSSLLVNPSFSVEDGEWWSNRAEYSGGANPEWYIGFITPTGGFVAVRQFLVNVSAEVAEEFDDAPATTVSLAGAEWQRIDRSALDDPGNDLLVYVTAIPSGGSLVVSGSAEASDIELVAERAFRSVTG